MMGRNGGLSAVEVLIALALSSTLLTAIANAYVRVKVATLLDEHLAEMSHDSHWLASTIAENVKSAATIAYLDSKQAAPSPDPCEWLKIARMPSAVFGESDSTKSALDACLPNKDIRKDDVILLARDGDLIADSGPGGVDVYTLEKRSDPANYGCETEVEIFSLLRRRYREGKQVYTEELLSGVRRWRASYGRAEQSEVTFVGASEVTNWHALRAVRLDVEVGPVCGPANASQRSHRSFAWIQTIALGQYAVTPE